jgi:hypothetical protein
MLRFLRERNFYDSKLAGFSDEVDNTNDDEVLSGDDDD